MLSVKDLEVPYIVPGTSETNFLKNINIDLKTNSSLGIVSRNQPGKPSLVQCIAQQEKPVSGSIMIDRQNLGLLGGPAAKESKALVGYVSKNNDLLQTKKVLDNIELPLKFRGLKKNEISHLCGPIIEQLGLSDIIRSFPSEISDYEVIKVKLARELVSKPKILVLDDITANLDIKGTQNIINKLKLVRRNYEVATLIFTQDIETIKSVCDEVSILHNDQLMSEGDTAHFIVNPKNICGREIVKSFARAELPWAIRRKLKSQPSTNSRTIVRSAFIDSVAPEVIIGHVIDNYGVKLNIINSYSEVIQNYGCHFTYIEITGDQEQVELAVDYLNQNRLFTEVLGYVT